MTCGHLPPQGCGTRAPCTVPSRWMMKLAGIVEDLLLGQRVAADGDLDDRHAGGVVLRTMYGGVMPGGMIFSIVWQVAVTWATAASILAPGWK